MLPLSDVLCTMANCVVELPRPEDAGAEGAIDDDLGQLIETVLRESRAIPPASDHDYA